MDYKRLLEIPEFKDFLRELRIEKFNYMRSIGVNNTSYVLGIVQGIDLAIDKCDKEIKLQKENELFAFQEVKEIKEQEEQEKIKQESNIL